MDKKKRKLLKAQWHEILEDVVSQPCEMSQLRCSVSLHYSGPELSTLLPLSVEGAGRRGSWLGVRRGAAAPLGQGRFGEGGR